MKKYKKILSITLISVMLSACAKKQQNQTLVLQNWNVVILSIRNLTQVFNERNNLIQEIYNDLSVENRSKNLEKLERVKVLSIEIQKKRKESLSILTTKSKVQDSVEIFKAGIEYLQSEEKLENHIPKMFKKMDGDINGIPTVPAEEVVEAAKEILVAANLYKNSMDKYYYSNKLDKKNITLENGMNSVVKQK